MGVTLVVNPGSSSKKYALYQDGRMVFGTRFERQNDSFSVCRITKSGDATCQAVAGDVYRNALLNVLDELVFEKHINSAEDIECVGVRVVAPGTFFQAHRLIDQAYLQELRQKEAAAPLHIPHIRSEIQIILEELAASKIVGVSDSAFHHTLPFVARNYSINRNDAKEFDIYRFGYHGLSVSSVARRISRVIDDTLPARVLVFHLGSGVSITALKDGESVDTTMGFSPVSGLVMGTRAGDIEAGALLELMRSRHMNTTDAHTYVNSSGGMFGVAGDSDMRHILERRSRGDTSAREALDLFTYNITKAAGACAAVLGGLDLIVLTATASERNPEVRKQVLSGLGLFDISIDEDVNDAMVGKEGVITRRDSAVKVAVMRTDEMGEIARIAEEVS